MTPPIERGPSPYQFQLGANYTHLSLGDGLPSFSGIALDYRQGIHTNLDERNRFFFNGLFRYGSLTLNTDSIYPQPSLSLMHLGAEAGYEFQMAPPVLSGFLFLGAGVNTFHSEGINLGHGYQPLQNGAAFALTLGGGMTLGSGVLQFTAAWQPNFGLEIFNEGAPPTGINPQAFYIGASIDLMRILDLTGSFLPYSRSLDEYFGGMSTPRVLIFGNYMTGYRESLLVGEARTTLYRPSDAENPLGFGLNVAIGVGEGNEIGANPSERLIGPFFEFEEAFLNLRLPIGLGTIFQGGRFFILGQPLSTPDNRSFTFTGLEDHETPINNQVSHSYQFHYALPLSFGALRIQSHVDDRWMLSLATLHDWDNFFGRSGGIAGYANIAYHPIDELSTSVTGIAGEVAGHAYTNLAFQAVTCLPAVSGCTITSNDSRFNAGLDYTWGQQEGSDWHSLATYLRLNIIEQLGISGRAEYFADPTGIRTGVPEELWGLTATVNVQPLPWLQFRGEIRHDEAVGSRAAAGPLGAPSQTLFGLNTALVF